MVLVQLRYVLADWVRSGEFCCGKVRCVPFWQLRFGWFVMDGLVMLRKVMLCYGTAVSVR